MTILGVLCLSKKDFYMISVYGDYMDGGFLDVKDYHKIVIEFVNTGILLHPDDF